MDTLVATLYALARWAFSATITGSVLVILILLAKWAVGNRLGARWHYLVWFLLLVRLAVPVLPASPVSLYNLLHIDRLISATLPADLATSSGGGPDSGVLPGTGHAGVDAGTIAGENAGSGSGTGGSNPGEGTAVGAGAPASDAATAGAASATWPQRALPFVLLTWFAGALIFAARIAWAEVRFRSKARQARQTTQVTTARATDTVTARATDPRLLACFDDAKRKMGLSRRNVELWESRAVDSPVAFGLVRPRLLLPAAMACRLDDEQLTNIFCHELAHVRRHDIAVNWVAAALRVLHWFNPLIWYGLGRMQEDQELSCDAVALAHLQPDAARGYGRTIISLLEIMSAPPAIPSTTGVRGNSALNKRRINMIALSKKVSLKWSALGLVVAILIAGCGLTNPQAMPTTDTSVANLSGVQAVKMIDERVGWVLTGSAVLRTTDGGANWADVSPAEVAGAAGGSTGGYTAGSLATVGPDAAYATFSANGLSSIFVFRTTDAGRTWARAEITQEPEIWNAEAAGSGPPVAAFQFVDINHGWLLATYGVAMGSEAVRVYVTADAGATWQLVDDVTRDPLATGSLPFGGHKTGLAFADASKGWVSGFDYGNSIVLYTTQDGGLTWARQPVAAPAGYSTEGGSVETRTPIFFAGSPQDGLLPVVFHAEGQPTIFYVSHDGGATWQPTAAVTSAANNSFVWSFPDPQHGFATDGDKLYVTTDGAQSWQGVTPSISLKNADGNGPTQLDFVSAETGWAIVGGSLVKTTDGGRTWAGSASGQ